MDDADITAERDVAEAPLRLAASHKPEAPLRLAASHKPEGPQPNGRCHYCDEIVDDYSRWCPGTYCRDAWEHDKRLKNGRV